MKRKVLSLFLVLATVICALPALSLVSLASEPVEKNYDYYKDLWYDEGHLVAFVDATDLSNLVINKAQDNSTASGIHNYIKITGGKLAGEYYMITNEKGSLTAQGGLPAITASQTSKSTWSSSSDYKIHIGNSFAANEIAGETAIGALEGVFNPEASSIASIEAAIKFNSASSANAGYYASAINSTNEGISGIVYNHDSTASKVFVGKYGALKGSKTTTGAIGKDAGVVLLSTLTFGEYSGTQVTGNAVREALMMDVSGITSYFMEANKNPNYQFHTIGTINEGDDIWAQGYGFDYQYIRIYDCTIDEATLKKNHFADLCYYYKLDVDNDIVKYYGANFYDRFAKMEIGNLSAGEVEMIQTLIEDPDADFSEPIEFVHDENYDKHAFLWYDNDHLVSFVDMSNLNTAGAVATVGSSTSEQIDAARVVIGSSVTATSNGTHSYAKIIGGKNAGYYYMLGADADSNMLSVTSDGYLDFDATFAIWGSNDAGIYTQYLFPRSSVDATFGGISNLGAQVKSVVRDSMFDPTAIQLYDKSYGTYTLNEVMVVDTNTYYTSGYARWLAKDKEAAAYSMDNKPGSFKNILFTSAANMGVLYNKSNSTDITAVGTGVQTSKGAFVFADNREITNGDALTLTYTVTFQSPTFFKTDVIAITEKATKLLKVNLGKCDGYTYKDDIRDRLVVSGYKMAYIRLYDCKLTDAQIMQNHFADLCYYYNLLTDEQLEFLRTKGGYVLTDEFYSEFVKFNIGSCDENKINSMKALIAAAIDRANAAESDAIAEKISGEFGIFAQISVSKAAADSIYNSYDATLSHVKSVLDSAEAEVKTTSDAEKREFINEQRVIIENVYIEMLNLKRSMKSYYLNAEDAFDAIKNINSNASAMQKDDLLMALTVCKAAATFADERYLQVAFFQGLIDTLKAKADDAEITYRAVDAIVSTNVNDFIKFAGYQVRVTDYVAIRALFVCDETAIEAGYTYGQNKYDIVSYGILCFKKGVEASVSYDGKTTVAENAEIIRLGGTQRYEVDSRSATEAIAATGENGTVVAMEKGYSNVPLALRATEYQQEYTFRVFMVLQNSNKTLTFVKYSDAVSENLGDSASIYEAASYIKASNPLSDALNANYNISKVLAIVDASKEEG